MPQLYIPSVGDRLRLTEDWEFPLHIEYRNSTLISRLQPSTQIEHYMVAVGNHRIYGEGSTIAVLEQGTVLRVDRIYVRKGKGEWDSITFIIVEAPHDRDREKKQRLKGARFWAKLADVNEIQYERVAD